jgi:hypothetical protein
VLADYQFGLITGTDDALRRHGFSAKHLDDLAHGLPGLVPAWRQGVRRTGSRIACQEDTFSAAVDRPGDERRWRDSDAAFEQTGALACDRTLRPLDEMLRWGRGTKGRQGVVEG